MNVTKALYRAARLSNDARALRRGPEATAKRAARVAGYRTWNRPLRKILRRAKLG